MKPLLFTYITVKGYEKDDLSQMTCTMNPGSFCPSFSISEEPFLGAGALIGTFDVMKWAKPPEKLTFSLDVFTWECRRSAPKIRCDESGISRTTTYTPLIQLELETHYGQPIHYISCTQDTYTQYLQRINLDNCVVKHKLSDDYPTSGWTVSAIIADICALVGLTPVISLPFDPPVGNLDQAYDPSSTYIEFIQSLLPKFLEVSLFATDDHLFVNYVDPLGTSSFTATSKDNAGFEYTEIEYPAYTAYEVTGGRGKPRLEAYYDLTVSSPKEDTKVSTEGATYNNCPAERKLSRTVFLDQFGQLFYQKSESERVIGSVFMEPSNGYSSGVVLDERIITYSNDLTDPLLYARSRMTLRQQTRSGVISRIRSGYSPTLSGKLSFLTTSLETLDFATLDARIKNGELLFTDVLLTGGTEYSDEYEEVGETWQYADGTSKDVPEGVILQNVVSTARLCIRISYTGGAGGQTAFFDATLSPDQILQTFLSDVYSKKITDLTSALPFYQKQIVSREIKTIKPIGKRQYVYQQRDEETDFVTGGIKISHTVEEKIDCDRLPSAPKELRRQTICLRSGKFGEKGSMLPYCVSVNTCNWEALGDVLAIMKKTKYIAKTAVSIFGVPAVLFPMQSYNGAKVVGFTVVDSGGSGGDISLTLSGFVQTLSGGL